MKQIKKLTDNSWVNIYQIIYPEKGINYQYAERKGINSVAFICYDRTKNLFLLNHEYTPSMDTFMNRAFGGSFDEKIKPTDLVIKECYEEAGYEIKNSASVISLEKCFVSTQMNQFCYLFLILVSDDEKVGRHPENNVEAAAKTVWLTEKDIIEGSDWKAISIISKWRNAK